MPKSIAGNVSGMDRRAIQKKALRTNDHIKLMNTMMKNILMLALSTSIEAEYSV